jgi:hypothetical protein
LWPPRLTSPNREAEPLSSRHEIARNKTNANPITSTEASQAAFRRPKHESRLADEKLLTPLARRSTVSVVP